MCPCEALTRKNDSHSVIEFLGINEIEKTEESVRAVREYARQGLKEGRGHDRTKPKIHY